MGFTTELLFVLMANIEARQQFIMHAPAATLRLVERSLSTDDLEAEFGILVNGCGYKPSFEMAVGFLEHMDFLFHVRRQQADYGLTLPKSSKCHYSWHSATSMGDSAWSDGGHVHDLAMYAKYRDVALDRARNVLNLKRDPTNRSFHSM
jgi:hypothetical protein